MGWIDWIVLILGAAVCVSIGMWLEYKIHKLKDESRKDMRKKLHGDEEPAEKN